MNVNFDFTLDTPGYWDNFWQDDILGGFGNDPDSKSKTLQIYHSKLWSRRLPNGKFMKLVTGVGSEYLTWNGFRFGSDSIVTSMRYNKMRNLLLELKQTIPDYNSYIENFLHKSYTIGGSIIFPKTNSINRARGVNSSICDRWDLTLECIRRFYNKQESPLYGTLLQNQDFFELFVDFKGYIDFFFLNDCVSNDYSAVCFWLPNENFQKTPLPQSILQYTQLMDRQLDFVAKRNKRIAMNISKG